MRQAEFEAAAGGPPVKPEYTRPGPPSAPPSRAGDLSLLARLCHTFSHSSLALGIYLPVILELAVRK